MPENLDTITEKESEGEDRVQEFLFSEPISSICYWATILLLGIAGAYLISWRLIHPLPYGSGFDDPWGVVTPPWLVEPLAPIAVVLSLGHAAWCAVRGQRMWKMIMTPAGLIAVLTCSKLFETYLR